MSKKVAPTPESALLRMTAAMLFTVIFVVMGFIMLFTEVVYALYCFGLSMITGFIGKRMLAVVQRETSDVEYIALLTERYPEDPRVWRRLGAVYLENSFFDDAERAFKKALQLDPEEVNALAGLATTYYQAEDFDTALIKWEEAANLDPTNELMWISIAYTRRKLDDHHGALDAFKHARMLNSESVIAHRGIQDSLRFISEEDEDEEE